MINCYPVWTAAAPVVRHVTHHIGRRIARHGFRHAALATVRIVCVSVPAWLAAPAPAAAPSIPAPETTVLPPAMLPWPGDDAPWGWGAGDMVPAYGPGADDLPGLPTSSGRGSEMKFLQPNAWTSVDQAPDEWATQTLPTQTTSTSDTPHGQPVPEPSSVAVMLVGIAALLGLRARQ